MEDQKIYVDSIKEKYIKICLAAKKALSSFSLLEKKDNGSFFASDDTADNEECIKQYSKLCFSLNKCVGALFALLSDLTEKENGNASLLSSLSCELIEAKYNDKSRIDALKSSIKELNDENFALRSISFSCHEKVLRPIENFISDFEEAISRGERLSKFYSRTSYIANSIENEITNLK